MAPSHGETTRARRTKPPLIVHTGCGARGQAGIAW